jgi:hypothetical protein
VRRRARLRVPEPVWQILSWDRFAEPLIVPWPAGAGTNSTFDSNGKKFKPGESRRGSIAATRVQRFSSAEKNFAVLHGDFHLSLKLLENGGV